MEHQRLIKIFQRFPLKYQISQYFPKQIGNFTCESLLDLYFSFISCAVNEIGYFISPAGLQQIGRAAEKVTATHQSCFMADQYIFSSFAIQKSIVHAFSYILYYTIQLANLCYYPFKLGRFIWQCYGT
jgi:hypothetical protein